MALVGGDVMQEMAKEPPGALAGAANAVEGNSARFREIVQEQYAAVLAYAQRILHDLPEAEDCTQEAFAEAFGSLHTLEGPGALPGWLRAIVRHRCLRRLRRRDLRLFCASEDMQRFPAPECATQDGSSERLAHVRSLIDELPAEEREVVLLFYLKQCSQREVAAFLGIGLGTVNNRLHQARQRLKKWQSHMQTSKLYRNESQSDKASRVGSIVAVKGPLIQTRFEPNARLDIFDALVMLSGDRGQSERMKVCRILNDGLALCLVTAGEEPIELGASVLNTRRVGLELTIFSRVPSVSSEHLSQAIEVLRGHAAPQPRLVETGIKAIDLLCPVMGGGLIAQVGTAGVGRMVLLEELRRRLQDETLPISALCLVHDSEPEPYRDWDEASTSDREGNLHCYWALSSDASDPSHDGLLGCDGAHYMSPILALQGMYPAVDAEHSWSRLLRDGWVADEHQRLAERARAALVWAKWAYTDPVALELLARRAHAAAQRRSRDFRPNVPAEERSALERARKLQLFLTQPFDTAQEMTTWKGCHVALADTLEGTRAILDGELDDIPSAAFAYAGTLDDVREHARLNVARRFG
jgi:RNA polymerase sigma factor (sigma-70 family)